MDGYFRLPYSGRFSEINIFGNYNENLILKLNFGIMSMWARVRVIVTGKLLWCRFFGYKISESEQDFGNFQKYLSPKFHATVLHHSNRNFMVSNNI